MKLLIQIQIEASHFCKLTDEHVFIKHSGNANNEWTMISLKDTKLISAYRGIKFDEKCEEKGLQFVICNEFLSSC